MIKQDRVTQEQIDELRRRLRKAEALLADSPAQQLVDGLRREYNSLLTAFSAQSKAEEQARQVQIRAESKARFDAAPNKRSLLDLLADESVTGTFKGWQFASGRGVLIKLPLGRVCTYLTWEELRKLARQRGRAGLMGLFVDGYRLTDGVFHSIPVGKVVAWKEEV